MINNFLKIVIILFFLVRGVYAASQEQCPKQEDIKKSDISKLAELVSSNNLVFFGETHMEDSEPFYLEILAKLALKDSKHLRGTCVFIETDENYQSFYDLCLNSPEGAFKGSQISDIVCDEQTMSLAWPYFFQGASNLGMSVFAMDSPDQNCSDECRNKHMANIINEKYQKNLCLRGIAINGSSHLLKSKVVENPIQSYLDETLKKSPVVVVSPEPHVLSSLALSHATADCKREWSSLSLPYVFNPNRSSYPLFIDVYNGKLIYTSKWSDARFIGFLPGTPDVRRVEDAPDLKGFLPDSFKLPIR